MQLHLDGARLFNALIAKKESAKQYGDIFDSISVCLNKGLGCPIGSILMGKKDYIKKARRVRKVFGGGMRQAGFMAAAGIYAFKNNMERLAEDHVHAKQIEAILLTKKFINNIIPVETNIVIAETNIPAKEIALKLEEQGIKVIAIATNQIRFVTHLDISSLMMEQTIEILKKL